MGTIMVAADGVEHVRLTGGQFFGGGYVEIWRAGVGWRAVCDRDRRTWTQTEGERERGTTGRQKIYR